MRVCFFLLIHGDSFYFECAKLAIETILKHTEFSLFISYHGDISNFPANKRLIYHEINYFNGLNSRPYRFLLKFKGVQDCIKIMDPDIIIMMDVDAIIIKRITTETVRNVLNGFPIAMVEQKKIVRSDMNRQKFLDHYTNFSLKVIAPELKPPKQSSFRYYNSGFVIAEKDYLNELSSWALGHIEKHTDKHEIDGHMIADQDYFQVWTNNIFPETCNELSWIWNHCEHWDDNFLDEKAIIIHFSNFCLGPGDKSLQNMRHTIFQSENIHYSFIKNLVKRIMT